jgi:hypothetical protein
VTPQYLDSIDFLKRFHPDRRWVLTAIDKNQKPTSIITSTFRLESAVPCCEWLERLGKTYNIYFSVGEVSTDVEKKANREDIKAVWWLHVDIDPRAGEDIVSEQARALALLKNPPGLPKPTVITFSGGGYQGFWKLKEPIIIDNNLELAEEAKRYNLQIELLLGADNVHNIDRIMRLPGSINRPDPLKKKKGRQEALSQVVEWNEDFAYDISEFTKAPMVQKPGDAGVNRSSSSVPTVQISGNIARVDNVEDLPPSVSVRCRVVIVQGFDPDNPKKFQGRSEWLFYVVCELIRAGITDEMIYSIITDPGFKISDSVIDKGSMTERYALRQIQRGKEFCSDPNLSPLNEKYCIIKNWGGKCRVIQEQFDEIMSRYRLTRITFEDFRNMHINQMVVCDTNKKNGNVIEIPLGDWWLRHPRRREFDKIIFAPGREVEGAYNQWRGFACEARPGDCSLFTSHLKLNICRNNEEYYDYLIKWMARSVQHPNSPGYAGIVFKGGQGTGKSFVAKALGSLFGRHFMQVTDPKHLVGSFNAHLRDCVILFGDEAFYAGDKKHESILKMLVTEEAITTEAKGVDAEVTGNCVHLLMASNEAWVVPAGMDDRRFFVLEVGNEHKNDQPFFHSITEQLNNGGRDALLHMLLTMDIKNFNVRNVPKTQALQQQKLFTLNTQDQWWYEKLCSGRLLESHDKWEEKVVQQDFEADYVGHCRAFNAQRRGSSFALMQSLKRILPEGYPKRVQTNTPVTVLLRDGTTKPITRPYWFKFPALKECRKFWDDNFSGPYDWPKIEMENSLEQPEVV